MFATPLLLMPGACSDGDREPAAASPAGVQAPGSAGLPHLAQQTAAAPVQATDPAQLSRGAANDLARVILHGPEAFGGTHERVGWRDAFSDQDVRDLIAHIRTLAAPEPGSPAGTSAS